VAFKKTLARRGVIAAAFALCGTVVIGCTSPPPMVNAKVTLPTRHATPPAAPSPTTNHFPASFRPDPGFVLTGNTAGEASNDVTFECCLGHDWSSAAADPRTWRPGEQVQITWIESAHPAPGSAEDTMFLSANMSGPWPTVAELRDLYEPDSDQVAAARVVRWSTESASSATSVITIPADAASGYYDLQFSAAAQGIGGCGTAACTPGFYDGAIIKVR
jgi:hypothetical protein